MKKILSLLLLTLPLAMGFTACSDDDDLPDVNMSITVSNATKIGDVIYVVQGDTLYIDSIAVVNNEAGKAAAITAATYYWDYQPLGTSMIPPYGFAIVTAAPEGEFAGTPVGKHLLQIETPLLAVDKQLATAVLVYTVEVVASKDDIPTTTPSPNTFIGVPNVHK